MRYLILLGVACGATVGAFTAVLTELVPDHGHAPLILGAGVIISGLIAALKIMRTTTSALVDGVATLVSLLVGFALAFALVMWALGVSGDTTRALETMGALMAAGAFAGVAGYSLSSMPRRFYRHSR